MQPDVLAVTEGEHDTPSFADDERDYEAIERSAASAREGILNDDILKLAEGMENLPEISGSIAKKYCGGGHGGYALYLFQDEHTRNQALIDHSHLKEVEPYCI